MRHVIVAVVWTMPEPPQVGQLFSAVDGDGRRWLHEIKAIGGGPRYYKFETERTSVFGLDPAEIRKVVDFEISWNSGA